MLCSSTHLVHFPLRARAERDALAVRGDHVDGAGRVGAVGRHGLADRHAHLHLERDVLLVVRGRRVQQRAAGRVQVLRPHVRAGGRDERRQVIRLAAKRARARESRRCGVGERIPAKKARQWSSTDPVHKVCTLNDSHGSERGLATLAIG